MNILLSLSLVLWLFMGSANAAIPAPVEIWSLTVTAAGPGTGCTDQTPGGVAMCSHTEMGAPKIHVSQTGTTLSASEVDSGGKPFTLDGSIVDNQVSFTIEGPGITFGVGPATTTYTGIINGNTITGTFSSSASWPAKDGNGAIVTETATWTGTFEVIKHNLSGHWNLRAQNVTVPYPAGNTCSFGTELGDPDILVQQSGSNLSAVNPELSGDPYTFQGTLNDFDSVEFTIAGYAITPGSGGCTVGSWNHSATYSGTYDPFTQTIFGTVKGTAEYAFSVDQDGTPIKTPVTWTGSFNVQVLDTGSVPPSVPPKASFTFSPRAPVVGNIITFDASASNDPDGKIVDYKWDFGDGNSLNGADKKISNHAYEKAGNHTVTLTVSDNNGLQNSTQQIINVTEPKLALEELRIMDDDKKIRQNDGAKTIDVIYQQDCDEAGNVITKIGQPIDEDNYPFSGPATFWVVFSGESKLRAKFKACSKSTIDPPEIRVDWTVSGGRPGSTTWKGFEGDVTVKMPGKVGSYTVDFKYTFNGTQSINVRRKLFVTKATPLASVNPPRLAWYEKATAWATGQRDNDKILKALLDGLYNFGKVKWQYHGGKDGGKCTWENLVDDPITCNYSDCYTFSYVFEKMSATLGLGGLVPIKVTGTVKKCPWLNGDWGCGFITNGKPSLDPNIPGNARPLFSNVWNRYNFTSHSLRKLGLNYYDATFNGIYSRPDDFIAWNLVAETDKDTHGKYQKTVEGAKVYNLHSSHYYNWPDWQYAVPLITLPPTLLQHLTMAAEANFLQFPGTANFRVLDDDGDGINESIAVDVDVDILIPGYYGLAGRLEKNGSVVAILPMYETQLFSNEVFFDSTPGPRKVTLTFSGEQIYQSGQDGPYTLVLTGTDTSGATTEASLQTPAYDHSSFGEVLATITGVDDEGVGENGDGRLEGIRANVDVNVRAAGSYRLQGGLNKDGESLVDISTPVEVTSGQQTVPLIFPGLQLKRSGQDGPYEGVVSLVDGNGQTVSSFSILTQPYHNNVFTSVIEPIGAQVDQGIDSNGNGLFDTLAINFGASFSRSGTFLLTGSLSDSAGTNTVVSEQLVTAVPGNQPLILEFAGPDIYMQQIDGPYRIEVTLRDPASQAVIDRVALPQETNNYQYTDFDPAKAATVITLAGASTDQGIDTDGNGLFNQLRVNVDVQLPNTGTYQWSARLVDSLGTEIGFYTTGASLNAGAAVINFIFDGERIGKNGIDGPYFVKDLLMFGGGTKLVATDVAKTTPYTVNEYEGSTAITINQPPIAKAGSDHTVMVNQLVTLDGSASSDTDNGPSSLTYRWTQFSGPTVELAGTNTARPSFTPIQTGSYTFNLIVNDGLANSVADSVTITVEGVANQSPIANAGADQTVNTGVNVALDGSGSNDPDHGPSPITYSWSQTGGPSVTQANPNTATPGFTPLTAGTYVFQLIVNDGLTASAPDTVTITVYPVNVSNQPPVANAGTDQTVNTGVNVPLNGNGSSDPDHGPSPITFSWSQTSGPSVTLVNATSATPGFTPLAAGTYVFQLVVNDGLTVSAPDTVTITVTDANAECLFNWAEGNYPSLFAPSGSHTVMSSDYAYRNYPATNAHLRVSMADTHVYYKGADGLLQDVGPLSEWLPKAGCQPPPPSDCLFNWAENNYPSLFAPSGSATADWGVYTYRYYWLTNAYLGVSSTNNHVYYMGADGNLLDEGPLSYWLPKAGCQ